jgi:ribosomal protein S18 acetylase RimI-like enzyme
VKPFLLDWSRQHFTQGLGFYISPTFEDLTSLVRSVISDDYPTKFNMIRDAKESDLPAVADGMVRLQQLHVDAYPDVYKPFSESNAISYLSNILSRPDFNIRVAIHSNRLAGHSVLAIESTPPNMFKHAQQYGHLTQVEVDTDFRRLGIGKLLLADVEEIAVRMGLNRILLDVWAFNDSARTFFCAGGYNTFGSKLVRSVGTNVG